MREAPTCYIMGIFVHASRDHPGDTEQIILINQVTIWSFSILDSEITMQSCMLHITYTYIRTQVGRSIKARVTWLAVLKHDGGFSYKKDMHAAALGPRGERKRSAMMMPRADIKQWGLINI